MDMNWQSLQDYLTIISNLLIAKFLSIASHSITDFKIGEVEEPQFQWRLNGCPN